MLKLFRKDSLTPQTERIYKVPLCIQDTIPIYRISENGIFELESPTNKDGGKKKIHQFDRMYLFEDINFSTQDEEEKEETGKRFETLLRSMNVSYKYCIQSLCRQWKAVGRNFAEGSQQRNGAFGERIPQTH